MVPEAPLERGKEGGLAPSEAGWFVVNAREAVWWESAAFGHGVTFEGETDAAKFKQLGINISVLEPGQPLCMYHRENQQEGFLVLSGEGLLLVEEQERPLKQWDFVHCPPETDHVIVGAGDGPCVVLAVGTRLPEEAIVYPESELAQRHNAGVDKETPNPMKAYAKYERPSQVPFRDVWLPG